MTPRRKWLRRVRELSLTLIAVLIAMLLAGALFTDLPTRLGFDATPSSTSTAEAHGDDDHGDHAGHADHAGHGHEHGDEGGFDSIELSPQGRANMGLRVEKVSVGTYTEYIEVPASVVDWPGQTHLAITSPLTGVIQSIRVSRGELIRSGTPLFTLRLTHQDLVETQEDFLALLGQVDVEEREIKRLSAIADTGAIAGKTLINREYERDKLLAGIEAARQSMLLHGLTEEQIDRIEQTRQLVRQVTIFTPTMHADRSLHHDSEHEPAASIARGPEARLASLAQPPPHDHVHVDADFLITELSVRLGQSVEAGAQLAQLSNYSEVLIEGHAFQRDAHALRQAAESETALQAVVDSADGSPSILTGLRIAYIGNEVDRQSRALPFYVPLVNEIERSEKRNGKKYVSWRFKPGQRMQLRVPIKAWEETIVVPKDAVAEEGPERYVFVENSGHFDRVPVHVLARDSISVAIANDGQLWPNQRIAVSGAHQLQMALKNKSGGTIDPHAGHSH